MATTPDIPLIDVGRWRTGDAAARAAPAARLDRAMQDSGFFLVTGHGIPGELRERLRTAARAFFALPAGAEEPLRCGPGGRGWIATGMEANAFQPFPPPVGGGARYAPVTAADHLLERRRAATVG